LRRYVQKPEGMRTSAFYVRLKEMNKQLQSFLDGDIDSKLLEEELKEILEFALPKTWRVHKTLSQFVCDEKKPKEILDICKDIERLEAKIGSLAVSDIIDNKKSSIPTDGSRHSCNRNCELKVLSELE